MSGLVTSSKLNTRLGVPGRAGHVSRLVTISKTQHASRGHGQGRSRVRVGNELKHSAVCLRVAGRSRVRAGYELKHSAVCLRVAGKSRVRAGYELKHSVRVSESLAGHASGLVTSSNHCPRQFTCPCW